MAKRKANGPSEPHLSGLTPELRERLGRLYLENTNLRPVLEHHKATSEMAPEFVLGVFLPDLFPVESCLGRPLSESSFEGDLTRIDCYAHEEISLYVALRAIEALHANDAWWRDWSTSGRNFINPTDHMIAGRIADSPEQVLRVEWMRVLFRACLCMPLGYLVSHTSWRVHKDGMGWNPADEDLPDFERLEGGTAKVLRIASVLDARAVSHATYRRLFPDRTLRVPGISLALCDFFSSRPNPSNPLYRAWHTAMHFFFYERFYPRLPFWWVSAINHHFVRSETYRPITCEISMADGETDWAPPNHRSPTEPALDQPAPNPAVASPVASTPTPPVPASPSLPEEPVPPVTPPASELPATPTPAPPRLSPLTLAAIRDFRDRCGRNMVIANDKGAVLQKHAGSLHLVYPLFFRQLSEFIQRPEATPEALQAALAADGLLVLSEGEPVEAAFEIRPAGAPRRLGKVRGIPLTPLGQQYLYPEGTKLPDNDALVPLIPRPASHVA